MKQIKDNYDFTSFEISKQLWELESFRNYTSEYHDYYYQDGVVIDAEDSLILKNNIPAITQSYTQKFLREVYNIHVISLWAFDVYTCELYYMNDGIKGCKRNVPNVLWEDNCSYEEALEQGIIESLKLI